MSKLNENAFKKIFGTFQALSGRSIVPGKEGNSRFFYLKTDAEEKRWLKDAKIEAYSMLGLQIAVAKISFDAKSYFALWGSIDIEVEFDPDVLVPTDINAGILTTLIAETPLNIPKTIKQTEFFDLYELQHLQPKYEGYDYKDLLPFLEPLMLFEAPAASALFNADIYRIACFYLLHTKEHISLPFTPDVRTAFEQLILDDPGKLSFENIFHALMSVNWRHAYLELYRCIERLFPLKFLKELRADLGISDTILQLSEKLDHRTSWRPREDMAIEKIMEDLPGSVSTLYTNYLAKQSAEDKSTKLHNYIYKTRNRIVHFRQANQFSLDETSWNELFILKLEAIRHLYQHHAADI